MGDHTEEITLDTYLAVERANWQNDHDVAALVISTGKQAKTLFRRLESLGNIELGSKKLSRFRMDLKDITPVLDLLKAKGHGVIYKTDDGSFEAHFQTRTGKVSSGLFVGYDYQSNKVYRGPKIKGWTNQFPRLR